MANRYNITCNFSHFAIYMYLPQIITIDGNLTQ